MFSIEYFALDDYLFVSIRYINKFRKEMHDLYMLWTNEFQNEIAKKKN